MDHEEVCRHYHPYTLPAEIKGSSSQLAVSLLLDWYVYGSAGSPPHYHLLVGKGQWKKKRRVAFIHQKEICACVEMGAGAQRMPITMEGKPLANKTGPFGSGRSCPGGTEDKINSE